MAGVFDFCPDYMIPRNKAPSGGASGMSMNGWFFSAKPKVPYQKTFVITLQGMYWYLKGDGRYDAAANPRYNARRLELFYEQNGLWDHFDFRHPHLGLLKCRFKEPIEVPQAIINSGGLIDAFDIQLIHHDPGY